MVVISSLGRLRKKKKLSSRPAWAISKILFKGRGKKERERKKEGRKGEKKEGWKEGRKKDHSLKEELNTLQRIKPSYRHSLGRQMLYSYPRENFMIPFQRSQEGSQTH